MGKRPVHWQGKTRAFQPHLCEKKCKLKHMKCFQLTVDKDKKG